MGPGLVTGQSLFCALGGYDLLEGHGGSLMDKGGGRHLPCWLDFSSPKCIFHPERRVYVSRSPRPLQEPCFILSSGCEAIRIQTRESVVSLQTPNGPFLGHPSTVWAGRRAHSGFSKTWIGLVGGPPLSHRGISIFCFIFQETPD